MKDCGALDAIAAAIDDTGLLLTGADWVVVRAVLVVVRAVWVFMTDCLAPRGRLIE